MSYISQLCVLCVSFVHFVTKKHGHEGHQESQRPQRICTEELLSVRVSDTKVGHIKKELQSDSSKK